MKAARVRKKNEKNEKKMKCVPNLKSFTLECSLSPGRPSRTHFVPFDLH